MADVTVIGRVALRGGGSLLVAGHGDRAHLEARLRDEPKISAELERWIEAPGPLAAWSARHGEEDPTLDLALFVDRDIPFVLAESPEEGSMIEALFEPGLTDAMPTLNVDRIEDVAPLDAQFGVVQPRTVPEKLEPACFSMDDKPLYAVLDAATVRGLSEILDGDGLRNRCLFRGEAAEELGAAAPWLVELPPDARFLRALMTDSGSGGALDLHSADAALFLHAPGGFDAVWKHLRKFTKLPSTDGAWVYFRFWDKAFRHWMVLYPHGPFPRSFFGPGDGAPVRALCRLGRTDWAIVTAPENATFRHEDFLPRFRRHTRVQLRRAFLQRVRDAIAERHGIALPLPYLARLYREARDEGYRRERALARRIEAGVLTERAGVRLASFFDRPEFAEAHTLSDVGRAALLLDTVLSQLKISA